MKRQAIRYPARPEGVTKLADLPPATEAEQEARIEPFRRIVANGQYESIVWYDHTGKRRSVKVDTFTAGIVVSAYNSAKPDVRAKVMVLEPTGIINLCYKAYKKV